MDTWKNAFFLQENHVHKIPRFLGGGFWVFGGGGAGSGDFIFMGAGIFLQKRPFGSLVQFIPMEVRALVSRTKNQPKEEVLGRISRGHPGLIRGYPGPKLRSGP